MTDRNTLDAIDYDLEKIKSITEKVERDHIATALGLLAKFSARLESSKQESIDNKKYQIQTLVKDTMPIFRWVPGKGGSMISTHDPLNQIAIWIYDDNDLPFIEVYPLATSSVLRYSNTLPMTRASFLKMMIVHNE